MARFDRGHDPSQLSDEALMARVATGDNRALELLYDRFSPTVYGLALRILANGELAEDVVQETFWRVWRRGSTFQANGGQFAPWLFGIARNLCIDELRRQQSRPHGVQDDDALNATPDTGSDVDTQVWHAEQRRLIVEAMRDLPSDQRRVIELAYFNGLSQREIAEQTNDPLGTVKTRTRLALQKLKGVLVGLGFGHDDR